MRMYEKKDLAALDEQEDHDEFCGFSIVDSSGQEQQKAEKKEENYNCDEEIEATPIPTDQRVALIENAKISKLSEGDNLTLKIENKNKILLLHNEKVVGELKPLFSKKLFEKRENQYVSASVFEIAPAMVMLLFSARKRKNSIKLSENP